MLSDRCRSVLSVCPVCNVGALHGQTVVSIKMPLGMEVGLGPGHIPLDGYLTPPQTGTAPSQFSADVYCAKRLDGSICHLVRTYASAEVTLY